MSLIGLNENNLTSQACLFHFIVALQRAESPEPESGTPIAAIVAAGVAVGIILLILVAVIFFKCRRYRMIEI